MVSASAQAPARPPIVGLDHVAFRISDVEAAQRFYGELLGYPVVQPRMAGAPLMVRVNKRQAIVLEPGLPADVDDRLSHIAFATADLPALKAYLDARGVVSEGPAAGRAAASALRAQDPDGNVVEFVQEDVIVASPPTSPYVPLSTRLYHTGVAVRDEAKAHAFYRDVLGLEEIWRGGGDPARTSWVNMRVPDGTDYVEYMLNDKPPTRQQLGSQHHAAPARARHAGGLGSRPRPHTRRRSRRTAEAADRAQQQVAVEPVRQGRHEGGTDGAVADANPELTPVTGTMARPHDAKVMRTEGFWSRAASHACLPSRLVAITS